MDVIRKTIMFFTFLMVAASGSAVFAASLSPDGDAFMIYESPIVVDPDADLVLGSTYCRDVARAADGSFVVIWQSTYKYKGSFEQVPDPIYAQRFTAEGSPLTPIITVAPEEPLGTYAGSKPEISDPSVACDASGNFVVAWVHKHPQITHEDNTWELGPIYIYARQFKADGTPLGERLTASLPYNDLRGETDVAMNDLGQFVIAWNGVDFSIREHYSIFMRRFDSDGTLLDTKPIHVNSMDYKDKSSSQRYPSVVIDNDGNIAIAWIQTLTYGQLILFLKNKHPYGCRVNQYIEIRFFNSRGKPRWLPITVSQKSDRRTDIAGAYAQIQAPHLCINNSGNVSVSWYVYDEGTYSRFYSPDGLAQSDIIPRSTQSGERVFGNVMDDNGNLAVLFQSSNHTYGKVIDANELSAGSAIQLLDRPSDYEWLSMGIPFVSSDSYGNIILVWRHRDPDKDGIMARNILFR